MVGPGSARTRSGTVFKNGWITMLNDTLYAKPTHGSRGSPPAVEALKNFEQSAIHLRRSNEELEFSRLLHGERFVLGKSLDPDPVHESGELSLGNIMVPDLLHHRVLAPLFHHALRLVFIINQYGTEQRSFIEPRGGFF